MGKDIISGKMEGSMMGIMSWIRNMGLECTPGQMGGNTKECG
jgi:hypothetical protein